jgi:hypothetical protein
MRVIRGSPSRNGELLSWGELLALTGGKPGVYDRPCLRCGPDRNSPFNRTREVLRVFVELGDFATYTCARCGIRGWARADDRTRPRRRNQPRPDPRYRPAYRSARGPAGLWKPLWHEARDPIETPVEWYLARERRTPLWSGAADAIRWHPSCPFRGVRTGCMMSLVRNVVTDQPQAIHRTAIDAQGRKVWINGKDRLALGPSGGGAIKLWPDVEVSTCLGVGEGIESTLSIRLHPEFWNVPVWSLLDAGHVRDFPVLPGLEGLIIAVDRDPVGQLAAHTLADRYRAAGVEVTFVRSPRDGEDLNDLVRAR